MVVGTRMPGSAVVTDGHGKPRVGAESFSCVNGFTKKFACRMPARPTAAGRSSKSDPEGLGRQPRAARPRVDPPAQRERAAPARSPPCQRNFVQRHCPPACTLDLLLLLELLLVLPRLLSFLRPSPGCC